MPISRLIMWPLPIRRELGRALCSAAQACSAAEAKAGERLLAARRRQRERGIDLGAHLGFLGVDRVAAAPGRVSLEHRGLIGRGGGLDESDPGAQILARSRDQAADDRGIGELNHHPRGCALTEPEIAAFGTIELLVNGHARGRAV